MGGSFDPLSQSEHGAVRGIQRSDSSFRSHGKGSPMGIADIDASTSTPSHPGSHPPRQNIDLLSQSEHGGGYQGMSSHSVISSRRSSAGNVNIADNSGGDNVCGSNGGSNGGFGNMSANTAYVNNLPRRTSNGQLYDALSKSDHGYLDKGQGLGMGVTSNDRRPGSSMRSIQRLKGQESGLVLEAPGPLPALSFALPKQDKVLTRSSTISSAVLSNFNQVLVTSANTSSNNTTTHNISPYNNIPTNNTLSNNLQTHIIEDPRTYSPIHPHLVTILLQCTLTHQHCEGHVGVFSRRSLSFLYYHHTLYQQPFSLIPISENSDVAL